MREGNCVITTKQEETVKEYRSGLSEQETADKLGISHGAVQQRLRAAAERLGLAGKTKLRGELPRYSVRDLKPVRATYSQLLDKLSEQGIRCSLSGEPLKPSNASLDHVVPASEGGDDTIDNLSWVRAEVNQMKGTMSVQDFIWWCKKVAEHLGDK